MAEKLYSVGYKVKNEEIIDSIIDWFENAKFEIKPGVYFTFKNIKAKTPNIRMNEYRQYLAMHKSFFTKFYADVVLHDGGKQKVVAKQIMIAKAPTLINNKKVFLVNGTEYSLANILRRKSGLYIEQNDNKELIIRGNFAHGRNFKIVFNPTTLRFFINIGSSNIPIYAFNESLGITKDEFQRIFGPEITTANYDALSPTEMRNSFKKLYSKFFEYKGDVNIKDIEQLKDDVKAYIENEIRVDSRVNNYLYGHATERIDKKLMLEVYKRFYKNMTGEDDLETYNGDLTTYTIYSPPLLFRDRLEKTKKEIENKIKYKLKAKSSIENIFKDLFTKPLTTLITTSNVSRVDTQYNISSLLTSSNIITYVGEGGVGDIRALSRNLRGVHPTYLGVIDVMGSPQGQKVGANLQLTKNVKVNQKGEIYIEVLDKKNKPKLLHIEDFVNSRILLPDQDPKSKTPKVMYKRKMITSTKGWDYKLKDGTLGVVSPQNALINFANSVQGNRLFMSYRFINQALPLKYRERPKVYSVNEENGKSVFKILREELEEFAPLRAPVAGKVLTVNKHSVIIKGDDGKKYEIEYNRQVPFATLTGINQIPMVKPGDRVKKNQILFRDEYTDKENKGELAAGVNLRTTYLPYKGLNSDDAVVISESAAKKLTSIHYYKISEEIDPQKTIIDKKEFLRYFPSVYTQEQLNKIDDNGIIKPGTRIKPGDPLVLAIKLRDQNELLEKLGKISTKVISKIQNAAIEYKKDFPGQVVEAWHKNKILYIVVKTEEPARAGDKISNLYGGKGVIAAVVPDKEMIHDENGEPLDVIWSSTVVVSRINPAQIIEGVVGEVARKKGIEFKVPYLKNPEKNKDLVEWAEEQAKKYKVKTLQKVYDPTTKKWTKRPVFTGTAYYFKLLKPEKDLSARGISGRYNSIGIPAKGGSEGAKAIGAAEYAALVSHGARANISEFSRVKSQFNPEFWKNFELGLEKLPDGNSEAFNKLKALLTMSGVAVEERPDKLIFAPLTDKLTDQLAGRRRIQSAEIVQSKSLKPIVNGLFDPNNVGGLNGDLWSAYDLHTGIVSPMFVDYVRLVLGMSKQEFLDWEANLSTSELKRELNKIDIDAKLRELDKIQKKKGKLTNNEIKIYRFLTNLKKKNMTLGDLVITKIPIMPAKYRPIMMLQNGDVQLDDINLFLKDVILADKAYDKVQKTPFASDAKKELIHSINALIGLEQTKNPQLKSKGSRSILQYVSGVGSPKNGYVHSKLLKKNQDLSARARAIPNPNLDMDTIGIPKQILKKIWEPIIRRKLMQLGYANSEIEKMFHKKSDPIIEKLIDDLSKERYIWYTRAPVLHRYGIMAAKPKPIDGTAIEMNLFTLKPLNLDFDGDAISLFAPATTKANKEAEKFLLSKLLFSDKNYDELTVGVLTSEAVLGLYMMSQEDKKRLAKDFKNIFGDAYKKLDIKYPLTKKNISDLMQQIAQKFPNQIAQWVLALRQLGEEYAEELGNTVSLKEIKPLKRERDRLYKKYEAKLKTAKSKFERAKILEQYQKELINLAASADPKKNDLAIQVQSGAKGKNNQLASIITSPGISYDPDNPIDTAKPVRHAFAEGLPFDEFWDLNAKARKDLAATFLNVALPGTLNKLLMGAVVETVITEHDCGTTDGVEMDTSDPGILGRVLAENVGKFKRNTIITKDVVKKLPKKVKVRSPLTCMAEKGVCQLCYGADPAGKFPEIGAHVGFRSVHSISEGISQKALDSKHGGRSITEDVKGLQDVAAFFSSDTASPYTAVVATEDGVVDKILNVAGLYVIRMKDGSEYVIKHGQSPVVKVGDRVEKGDVLSDGVLPFTEVAKYKGILRGRKAFVDGMKKVLDDIKVSANPKHLETIAKHAVNYVTVLTKFPPEHIIPGDTITYGKLRELAKKYAVSVPLNKVTYEMQLGEEFDQFGIGDTITSKIVQAAKKHGKKYLKVLPENLKVEVNLSSLYTAGLANQDEVIGNLSQRYLSKIITDAAAYGNEQPLTTQNPYTKWIMGRTVNELSSTF